MLYYLVVVNGISFAFSFQSLRKTEEEDVPDIDQMDLSGKDLPQSTDKTTEALDTALKDLTPR